MLEVVNLPWQPVAVIFVLAIIDYFTGFAQSIVNDCFDSGKMRRGLWHKGSYAIVLIVCVCVDYLCQFFDMGFNFGGACFYFACLWLAVTEVGSILENLVLINPKLADNAFMMIFSKRERDDMQKTAEMNLEDLDELLLAAYGDLRDGVK